MSVVPSLPSFSKENLVVESEKPTSEIPSPPLVITEEKISQNLDEIIARIIASDKVKAFVENVAKESISTNQMEEMIKLTLQSELETTKLQTDNLIKEISESKLSQEDISSQILGLKEQINKLEMNLNILEEATEAEVQRGSETRQLHQDDIAALKTNINELSDNVSQLQVMFCFLFTCQLI